MYWSIFLFSFIVCKLLYDWLFTKDRYAHIPGPKTWPLVGNLFQLDLSGQHKTFFEWKEIYGSIFKVKIISDNVVLFNDYESIHEMLKSDQCCGRPNIFRVKGIILKDLLGIVFESLSPDWTERKKLMSRSMNAHGTAALKLEETTFENINRLFIDIENKTNGYKDVINVEPLIHKCVGGIITALFYGYNLEESILMEMLEYEKGLLKLAAPAGPYAIIDVFPWSVNLPFKFFQDPIQDSINLQKWAFDRYRESLEKKKENNCILHDMLSFTNKATGKKIEEKELVGVTMDVIIAGFVTSTTLVCSLILTLINYPSIQTKLHQEVMQIIGCERPRLSHRLSMPYMRAVMEELYRYVSIIPLGIAHEAMQDVMIRGTLIPKGALCLPNFWALHHDERYHDDPWRFKPERYLTTEGQLRGRDDDVWKYNMAFSAGRRACPGEGLGRARLLLLIASLVQRYEFKAVDEDNIPPCDPHHFANGAVLFPPLYKVKIIERAMMKISK